MIVLLVAGLQGCSIAPVRTAVAPVLPVAYPQARPAADSQARDEAGPIDQWWRTFDDPVLNALVEQAQQANHDVRAAVQRVRQAREGSVQEASLTTPSIGLGTDLIDTRSGLPDIAKRGQPDVQGVRVHADLAWELDVMGGGRAGRAAAAADFSRARWGVSGAQLLVSGEVVRQYVTLRTAERQAQLLQAIHFSRQASEALLALRVQEGQASQLDLDRARNERESAAADLSLLAARQVACRNALALLLGEAPGSALAALQPLVPTAPDALAPLPQAAILQQRAALEDIHALATRQTPSAGVFADPGLPPTGQPASLLQRRPDIQAAGWQAQSIELRRQQAHADRYPRFFINALFGGERLNLNSIPFSPARYSSAAAAFSLPILDGGRRASVEQQAAASRDEAQMQYEQTVLRAVQEVDSALAQLNGERARQQHVTQARDLALVALRRVQALQREGEVDGLGELDLERAALAAQLSVADGESTRALAAVQLYQALGGGWVAPAEQPLSVLGRTESR